MARWIHGKGSLWLQSTLDHTPNVWSSAALESRSFFSSPFLLLLLSDRISCCLFQDQPLQENLHSAAGCCGHGVAVVLASSDTCVLLQGKTCVWKKSQIFPFALFCASPVVAEWGPFKRHTWRNCFVLLYIPVFPVLKMSTRPFHHENWSNTLGDIW